MRPTHALPTAPPAAAGPPVGTGWRPLGAGAGLLAVVLLTGAAVHALITEGGDARWRPRDMADDVLVAAVYTGIMTALQYASFRVLNARWPVRGGRDVAAHLAVQSAVIALSFVVARVAGRLVEGDGFAFVWGIDGPIGAVGFMASLVINGVFYLRLFYARVRAAEAAALRAELGALRAQVNPHFLFNALNSIAALVRTRPAEAEAVTEHLADLFRYSLRASEQPSVTLAEEVASVETYLAIERARFRDRLQATVAVPEASLGLRVPSLILQPLVENAVKHGVSRVEGPCEVRVEVLATGGALVLRVTDTGPGFDEADAEVVLGRGVGLRNVRDRLRAHFGQAAGLAILPDGVEVRLPAAGLGDAR
jgi:two-component system sensor histidine kinase AlgZ